MTYVSHYRPSQRSRWQISLTSNCQRRWHSSVLVVTHSDSRKCTRSRGTTLLHGGSISLHTAPSAPTSCGDWLINRDTSVKVCTLFCYQNNHITIWTSLHFETFDLTENLRIIINSLIGWVIIRLDSFISTRFIQVSENRLEVSFYWEEIWLWPVFNFHFVLLLYILLL